MAVYRRNYKPYAGALTPTWSRSLVLFRYSRRRLFQSNFVSVQGVFAFLLTAFTGPGLISPDLANGALPLYFCRPFSRAEYVIGKSSVLAILLSQITWVPGLVLFAVQ